MRVVKNRIRAGHLTAPPSNLGGRSGIGAARPDRLALVRLQSFDVPIPHHPFAPVAIGATIVRRAAGHA